MNTPETHPLVRDVVPFGTAVRAWFGISLQTFGGPAGQIAVLTKFEATGGWGSG